MNWSKEFIALVAVAMMLLWPVKGIVVTSHAAEAEEPVATVEAAAPAAEEEAAAPAEEPAMTEAAAPAAEEAAAPAEEPAMTEEAAAPAAEEAAAPAEVPAMAEEAAAPAAEEAAAPAAVAAVPAAEEEAAAPAEQPAMAEEAMEKMEDAAQATEEAVEEVVNEVVEAVEEPKPVGKGVMTSQLNTTSDSVGTMSSSVKALLEEKKGGASIESKFNAYSETMTATTAQLETLKSTTAEFKTNMQAHFDAWKAEMDGIDNEKIKKAAKKRWEGGTKSFKEFNEEMAGLEKKLAKYPSDMEDVRKFLSFDLTPDGVDEIDGSLDSLLDQGEDIQKQIKDIKKVLSELPEPLAGMQ